MRCPSCRASNLEGMLFCARCGRALTAAPELEAESESRLVWKSGDHTTQEFVLPSTADITIGRVAGNDIILPDSSVSRQHARIVYSPTGCKIEDLGSLNGTTVNGVRIAEEHPLQDGDVVQIGKTSLRVFLPKSLLGPIRLKEEVTEGFGPSASLGTHARKAGKPPTRSADRAGTSDADPAGAGATLLDLPLASVQPAPTPAAEEEASDPTISAPAPPSEPPAPAAWLVATTGERYPIHTSFTVGRADTNDLALAADRQISRRHARFEWRADGLWVEDLGSSNGTFVNAQRLTAPRCLAAGDRIRIGGMAFELELPVPPAVEEEPAADDATLAGLPAEGEDDDRTFMAIDDDRTFAIYQEEAARALRAEPTDSADSERSDGTMQLDFQPRWPLPEPISVMMEPSSSPRLIVNWGPQVGRRFDLVEPVTVIGRAAPDADYQICLDDRAVSRPHARITLEDGRYTIADLESANGTWVNYSEVKGAQELHDGDVVKLGSTVMVFRTPTPVRPTVPERHGSAGQVIAVFSLRGGAGTTTLAVNLALLLQKVGGEPVAIVDGSLERGAVSVHLNQSPKRSLADLAGDNAANFDAETLRALLTRHESGVDVVAAPPSPQTAELVTSTLLVGALNVLRQQYRWIVVDTSSTFSEFNLSLFDHADLILVVMGSDLTSLKVTQATLDIFAALFVPGHKRVLVLNQPQPYAVATREAIERALGERVDLLVPHGAEAFATAADTGKPLAFSQPEHPSIQALEAFARKLAGVDQPAATKTERVGWAAKLKRLLGVKG